MYKRQIITLSSVGKVTIVKDFTVKASEKVIDLGKLNMAEATNELKGIEDVYKRQPHCSQPVALIIIGTAVHTEWRCQQT